MTLSFVALESNVTLREKFVVLNLKTISIIFKYFTLCLFYISNSMQLILQHESQVQTNRHLNELTLASDFWLFEFNSDFIGFFNISAQVCFDYSQPTYKKSCNLLRKWTQSRLQRLKKN